MARTNVITLPKDSWTQLTNSDATAVTFQVRRGTVQIAAVVGAVAPTDFDKAVEYRKGQGEAAIPLASLAPGTAGANRVYAHPGPDSAEVYISHA